MANLGGEKIFLLLVIALVVLGPDKLPEAARKIGGFIRQVKSMSAGFEAEVRKAIDVDALNPFHHDETTMGDTPFQPEQTHMTSTPTPDPAPAPDLTPSLDSTVPPEAVPSPDTVPVAELETDIRARNDQPASLIASEGDLVDAPEAGNYPAAS